MTLENLSEYGMNRMDDEAVEQFLTHRGYGVLGLPTEAAPYLLPMSYGYAGGKRMYFSYVVGDDSRKDELSDRAETASFLVFNAQTVFNWRSVSLTGSIHRLPEEKGAELSDEQLPHWRPELFETANENTRTSFYEFQIEEWSGISQSDLPPGFY